MITKIKFQKWYIEITLVINNKHGIKTIALVDSGEDQNCIQE